MTARASVPCNGCTACCRGEAIVLHPERGDDPLAYETRDWVNPVTGSPCQILTRKPNGDCTYLGEAGCTIHERAPVICQEFDCGRFVQRFSRPERRILLRKGLADREIFRQGVRVLKERAAC